MPSKLTFDANSIFDFDKQTSVAENYFCDFDFFGGLTIHCYQTYRSFR
ncbi:hypothetical protein [Neorhodopirellula lusitana]|nr:hypothetical protein [Neorhodopirellula lusitana]